MKKIINGKNVFIEEEHHHVLKHWINYKKETGITPFLITLDHHVDTITAFDKYIYFKINENVSKRIELSEELIDEVDLTNFEFIDKLKNDEHIDFATKKNIISQAYVISFEGSSNICEDMQNNKICYLGFICYSGCVKKPHDDECSKINYDRCIESNELNRRTKYIFELGKENYILDIDLDFFHTKKSIHPDDTQSFYELINNASIITIASEPKYVKSLKVKGENIDSKYLLEEMLKHIEKATE